MHRTMPAAANIRQAGSTGLAVSQTSECMNGDFKVLLRADRPDPAGGNDKPEKMKMRMILLSALFALGVGLAGIPGATAAPAAAGINDAAKASSLLQDAQYYYRRHRRCYSRRVCYINQWGHRRCHYRTVCR